MESVGSFEAKTHLPALLARAEKGETIIITRYGRPVARLVPPLEESEGLTVEQAVAGLLEFGKQHPLKGITVQELIREGRKY